MATDSQLMQLARAIAAGDASSERMLEANPHLATAVFVEGATRHEAKAYFLEALRHYIYTGDTALHVAAAAHHVGLAQRLIDLGADVQVTNRRRAAPLHYAADGSPGLPTWNPVAQAATISCLIKAGADPNAVNQEGATPLHRAVRTRCALAVQALLEGGADVNRKNKSGSTALLLATQNTGRSGSGSAEAKAQQQQILKLLRR